MDDVLLMQELEGKASLSNYLHGLFLRKSNTIERIVQVLPLQVLLYDKKVLSVLENVIHADNIWMACVHKHFELIDEEVIENRLLRQQILFEYLEGKEAF